MKVIGLLLAVLILSACEVGPFPKDPTTAPSSWPVVDPDTDPAFAAAGGSSCANAIENSKRLGCGFEADDPAKWCASRTAKEIGCMSAAKACLAFRACAEAS